jgi:hypothetical protein
MKKIAYHSEDYCVEIEMPDHILPIISELLIKREFKLKVKNTVPKGEEYNLVVLDEFVKLKEPWEDVFDLEVSDKFDNSYNVYLKSNGNKINSFYEYEEKENNKREAISWMEAIYKEYKN